MAFGFFKKIFFADNIALFVDEIFSYLIGYGAYLTIHRMITNKFPHLANHSFFRTRIVTVFSIFVIQYFIFLAWIAFRVRDFDHIIYSMQKYVLLDIDAVNVIPFISTHKFPLTLMSLFVILHFVAYRKTNLQEIISNFRLRYWIVFLSAVMLLIFLFYDGRSGDFIYFKF